MNNDRVKLLLARFYSRILYAPLIFILFYEVIPELICRKELGGYNFDLFVSCNSNFELMLLSFYLIIFLCLPFLKFSFKGFYLSDIPILDNSNKLANVSLLITSIAAAITIYYSLQVPFERVYLVEIYHKYFAGPLVLPFVYLTIFLSFYKFIFEGNFKYSAISLFVIFCACIFTQSRGLMLTALLPFLCIVTRRSLVVAIVSIILLFYLRDIVNGSFEFMAIGNGYIGLKDRFGEMYNTWFGRRLLVNLGQSPEFSDVLIPTAVNLSGLKLILMPFIKLASFAGYAFVDHVTIANYIIEANYGFMGVAGSFLSDFIFFPLFSFIIAISFAIASIVFFKSKIADNVKFIYAVYAICLLPQLFRWSSILYFSSGIGFIFCATLLSFFITKAKTN